MEKILEKKEEGVFVAGEKYRCVGGDSGLKCRAWSVVIRTF